MDLAAEKSSAERAFGETLERNSASVSRFISLPVAVVFALIGQFAIGWLVVTLTPPRDPAATGGAEAAVWAQGLLLLFQGAALVFAVARKKRPPSRAFFAIAAFVWAVASMLLVFIALQCDLGGVCL